MAAKKDTLSNSLLNAVLRNVAYSSPAAVFAALYTVAPTNTTPGTEVDDGPTGYTRIAVTFDPAASGATSNTGAVTWPPGSAGGYGTVVAVALCTSAVVDADDQLYYGLLDVGTLIGNGDEASFDVGALVVTES